jgi:hypothetical protein
MERSAQFTQIDLDPSDLQTQTHAVSNYFNMIKNHEANRVHAGGLAGAPTTASTQATGAGGVTEWRVNVSEAVVAVGGVAADVAAAADFVIHDTTNLLADGQSIIAALVAKNVSGTITVVAVKGTAATTGSQVAPNDGTIQTAVGAGNDWVKLAECTLNRTADTTVTQSEDNTKRPILGVNADSTFATFVG